MTGTTIEQALAGLAGEAPDGLEDKVFTGWLSTPSRLGEVFVAFTTDGVQFVRSAESVGSDPDAFAQAYRDRFGRPLRPAGRGPAGLAPALTGRTGGPRLDLRGLSDFEHDVLDATRRIPSGQVRPYSWVAREAGRAKAVRAVGSVLARNPVPLLIPCHRVVRSDGALGEYMFGPEHKQALLREEDLDLDRLAGLTDRGVHYLGSDTTGVVCFPTCHHARRITDAHRRPFARVEKALAEGYRPCRDCRPAVPA
ncbi:methylated-DNA--[protein]-cysteine S-methyltransferase [Pseudonocardia sp. KRD291]|uniref:methylated-DNA--[protein]-cysteine S-methyltransferase n=1 Tax=Pseudonocardia sp. KRD291 TaxID=2792007 RepID=UPI001C49D113|nr:MGMT family protein [Pseudonocardia sp. KRD291]MBW0105029.1 methylated-DNA--[protein]-cysteine S-methyltransferase [Pseudonocardia sp. KRD291]